MAQTTIKSTSLDFESIKNNLKTFLQQKEEFSDYNFEGSGLSNILDVLAYNTHYNALIANFALNESYITTAQLRGSLVSLAQSIGYQPRSVTAATGEVQISLDLTGVTGRPSSIEIPSGYTFTGTINGETYTFQTRENLIAYDQDGIYNFEGLTEGSSVIKVYEGLLRTKSFKVGPFQEGTAYVIPDERIDVSTLTVRVYESSTSDFYTTYTNIENALEILDTSNIFVVRESANRYHELFFGNGVNLQNYPQPGNVIQATFLRSNGPAANGVTVFSPSSDITVNSVNYTPTVVTVSPSAGGSEKEDIESIRINSPYVYAAQNRMVTASDYSALVGRDYGSFLEDIVSWGGEDNPEPDFGVTYMSLRFKDGISEETQTRIKNEVQEIVSAKAMIPFDLKFADPVVTYIETDVFFQFNPSLTTSTLSGIREEVRRTTQRYFDNNIGGFRQSFRRSNLLSEIDDVDQSVLSSRATVYMYQRIEPFIGVAGDYTLTFPGSIIGPEEEVETIISSKFNHAGSSRFCVIKNKPNSNILQVVELSSEAKVVVDNVGEYIPGNGSVRLRGLQPTSIPSENFIRVRVIPANQSAISPVFNNVLDYDAALSSINAVAVESI